MREGLPLAPVNALGALPSQQPGSAELPVGVRGGAGQKVNVPDMVVVWSTEVLTRAVVWWVSASIQSWHPG